MRYCDIGVQLLKTRDWKETQDKTRWERHVVVKLGVPALRKLLGCREHREREDHRTWGKYRYPFNDAP